MVVDAVEFLEAYERDDGNFWIEGRTRDSLKNFSPDDTVKFEARLAIVNLVQTGYLWGYPIGASGPTIPAIAGDPTIAITEACRLVHVWLGSDEGAARELVHDLNSKARREAGHGAALSFDPPAMKTIYNWHRDEQGPEGVYALVEGRSGPRRKTGERNRRRANAERLVDDYFAARTERDSTVRDVTIIYAIEERAAAEGIALPGATTLRQIVKTKHDAHGRTPAKASTERLDRRRGRRGAAAPPVLGTVGAWDVTISDVMVQRTPEGKPFRAVVHLSAELGTGVITASYATARYTAANVLLMAYDAFRPIVIFPTAEGAIGRFKQRTKHIHLSDPVERALIGLDEDDTRGFVFKPGCILPRVRFDNAKQNSAMATVSTMRRYGTWLSPSQVGNKTNNYGAENVIGEMATVLEQLPAYIGRSPSQRGRRADHELRPLLLEQLNAELMERVMLEHNAKPCTTPAFRGSGLSRLEAWDEAAKTYGEPPKLTDPKEWFQFLPRKTGTLGRRGLSVPGGRFDDHQLRNLPKHLVDKDRRVEFIWDPRRLEKIWIPDEQNDRMYVVENVLTDYMKGPLVGELRQAALRRAGLPDAHSVRQMTTLARHMEAIATDPEGTTVAVERDLADWSIVGRVAAEVDRHLPADYLQGVAKSQVSQSPSADLADRRLPLPEERR
ncbi:Mu transposase C-terminal domain-containing protein [Nocardioides aromaticivorans]|nr:Mu transposase C-terminal domain-containing protein [Nocardioides aromaticivorans]